MSGLAQFFLLAAIEMAGLFGLWFLLRARIRRYLEIGNLLAGVREEARALVMELNETADRNVSLVEDRMVALRELLDELDRRIGVERRVLETRDTEREVYARLNKRRPIVPAESRSEPPRPQVETPAPAPRSEEPITLNLGASAPERPLPVIELAEGSVVPAKTRREEAFELYKRGFSADLIAARTGATVAEIELLIEIEERRAAGKGSGA
jgi:hypothetical protein